MSARTRRLAKQAETLACADMSEAQFQAWIVQRALAAGFARQFHVLRSQVKGRWLTNTSTSGVPDLWLLRPGPDPKLIVLEVKAQLGVPSPEQLAWIAGLQAAGIDAYIVKPSDAAEVLHLLAATPPQRPDPSN